MKKIGAVTEFFGAANGKNWCSERKKLVQPLEKIGAANEFLPNKG